MCKKRKKAVKKRLEESYEKSNDYSLIAHIQDGELNYLFGGDAEEILLGELLERKIPSIDLYKLPHHGKWNENSKGMIEKVSPEIGVITNKKADERVIKALEAEETDYYYVYDEDLYFFSDGVKILKRQVMEYSPDTRFVQVYLKTSEELDVQDQYAGIYLLTEKIERGPNRVDIVKNDEKFNDTSFIMSRDKIKSGDIVLQTDWNRLEEEYIIIPKDILKMRTVFTVSYPSKNNITERDKENMVESLDNFEYALRSSDFRDKKDGYAKYIDVDSFVNRIQLKV